MPVSVCVRVSSAFVQSHCLLLLSCVAVCVCMCMYVCECVCVCVCSALWVVLDNFSQFDSTCSSWDMCFGVDDVAMFDLEFVFG